MKRQQIRGLLLLMTLSSCSEQPLDLVPWPRSVEVQSGTSSLGPSWRIVAVEEDLLPLARVLSEEIDLATGLVLQPTVSDPRPGDIVLEMAPALEPEHYTLEVSDMARVRAPDYAGIAMGTVTLLQASASGPYHGDSQSPPPAAGDERAHLGTYS